MGKITINTTIVIFHKNVLDEKIKRLCFAELIEHQGIEVTFSTEVWIPPELGSHHYLKVEEKEDRRHIFRRFDVFPNPAKQPPYIYTAKLLEEWSGFVDDEEFEKKEE